MRYSVLDLAPVIEGGDAALARVARAAGVDRFIYYSTISVYGSSAPAAMLDELSPLRGRDGYARSKIAAEESVRSELGAAAVTLRLAAVYGPRLKGNYARLFRAIRSGQRIGSSGGNPQRSSSRRRSARCSTVWKSKT